MSDTLADIARMTASTGCILWECSDELSTGARDHLYVLAQWFPESFCAVHDLPMQSVTGEAVSSGTPQNVPNIAVDSRVHRSDPFLREQGIRSFCSIPLAMPGARRGALNVYRQSLGGFTTQEVALFSMIGPLLGPMYAALSERVSSNLLQAVTRKLVSSTPVADEVAWRLEVETAAARVCEEVGIALNSTEVSIFVRDDLPHIDIDEPRPTFSLAASTWRAAMKKTSYAADYADGLTGGVLASKLPFRIMDLTHFTSEQTKHPARAWSDSLDVQALLREAAEVGRKIPPLSFMAAPIMNGDDVLGAIRCSMAKGGAYYYTHRELTLLEVVAATFAAFLQGRTSELLINGEIDAWKAVIASVGKLNHFVYSELSAKPPSEKQIFQEALRVTATVIPGAEITDVRLLDPSRNVLVFAHRRGESWNQGTPREIKKRLTRRFKVGSGKIKSAGEYVMRQKEVYLIRDVRRDPYYSETFPNVKQMIVAPIMVHDNIYGVLDIRATSDAFPPYATGVADLVGRQLGLYHYLAATIRQLSDAETELKRTLRKVKKVQEEQAQAFEDLAHQLKTPVNYAHARAQVELSPRALASVDPKAAGRLLAIRGNIGKLRRVTLSLGLLIDLARGIVPAPDLVRVQRSQLVKLLIETAVDHQSMMDPDRPVRFQVHRDTFDVLERIEIEGSWDLLEQAINTLLDNAGKYSFGGTEVRIYGGITSAGRFHISVNNEGLALRSREINRAKQRGWRSDEARDVTGEGTGIGLWVVDNIMKAQRGELIINPTSSERRTDIKLVFPIKRGLVDVRHDRGR